MSSATAHKKFHCPACRAAAVDTPAECARPRTQQGATFKRCGRSPACWKLERCRGRGWPHSAPPAQNEYPTMKWEYMTLMLPATGFILGGKNDGQKLTDRLNQRGGGTQSGDVIARLSVLRHEEPEIYGKGMHGKGMTTGELFQLSIPCRTFLCLQLSNAHSLSY